MREILRDHESAAYPDDWFVNDETDDTFADLDFGPLNIRDDDDDFAALLRVREADVRREVAQRFEEIVGGGER